MTDRRFTEKGAPVAHPQKRALQLFRHFKVGELAEQRIFLLRPRKLTGRTRGAGLFPAPFVWKIFPRDLHCLLP
jgi:hypothetical protein